MNIEKEKLAIVLCALQEAFPGTISNWEPLQEAIGSSLELTGYLVYLKDHGYIEGNFTFAPTSTDHPWKLELKTTRINAAGIDYLEKQLPSPAGWIRRQR